MLQGHFSQVRFIMRRFFFPPDCTVGPGFSPDQPCRLAGLAPFYR